MTPLPSTGKAVQQIAGKCGEKQYCTFSVVSLFLLSQRGATRNTACKLASSLPASQLQGSTRVGIWGLRTSWVAQNELGKGAGLPHGVCTISTITGHSLEVMTGSPPQFGFRGSINLHELHFSTLPALHQPSVLEQPLVPADTHPHPHFETRVKYFCADSWL